MLHTSLPKGSPSCITSFVEYIIFPADSIAAAAVADLTIPDDVPGGGDEHFCSSFVPLDLLNVNFFILVHNSTDFT